MNKNWVNMGEFVDFFFNIWRYFKCESFIMWVISNYCIIDND